MSLHYVWVWRKRNKPIWKFGGHRLKPILMGRKVEPVPKSWGGKHWWVGAADGNYLNILHPYESPGPSYESPEPKPTIVVSPETGTAASTQEKVGVKRKRWPALYPCRGASVWLPDGRLAEYVD